VKDLVGISIPNPAQDVGVGQSPLQGVSLTGHDSHKLAVCGLAHFETSWVVIGKVFTSFYKIKGSPFLRTCLGNEKGAVSEVEGSQTDASGHPRTCGPPLQSTGDHQVQNEEVIAFQPENDTLAKSIQADNFSPGSFGDGRPGASQQKDAFQPNCLKSPIEDTWLQGVEVKLDIGKFRHGPILTGGPLSRELLERGSPSSKKDDSSSHRQDTKYTKKHQDKGVCLRLLSDLMVCLMRVRRSAVSIL
jgi:hypothetical protein